MRTSTFSRFLVKYVILKLCSDILCCHICSQQPWRRERSSRKSANLPHRVLPPAHSYGAAVNVSIQMEVSLSLSPFIASAGAARRIEELNRSSVTGVIARSSVARPFGQQEECNLIADILLWYLSFDMLSRGLGHVSLPHRAAAVMLGNTLSGGKTSALFQGGGLKLRKHFVLSTEKMFWRWCTVLVRHK